MRHTKKHNKIGRTASHRDALMANMANSLIEHKRINTTLAKARMLRRFIEPLITKSKSDSTHSRRTVFSLLQNKYAVTELFREIAPKIADRPGGYTRILKTGFRKGDGAEMCFIELVDFNEDYTQHKERQRKKTRRSRRGSGGGATGDTSNKTAAPATKANESEDTLDQTSEPDVAVVDESPVAEKEAEVSADDTSTESESPPVGEEAPVAEAKEEDTKKATEEEKENVEKEDKKDEDEEDLENKTDSEPS